MSGELEELKKMDWQGRRKVYEVIVEKIKKDYYKRKEVNEDWATDEYLKDMSRLMWVLEHAR